jgi:hypothetical protein
MIIWGFGGSKLADKGAVWPATCPNCHNGVYLHHVTTHASFRLFFVPIIPYGRKHHLMCPICQRGVRFDPKLELPRIEAAKMLLVQARTGEITDQQYRLGLEQLHNQAPATLSAPATLLPPAAPPMPAAPPLQAEPAAQTTAPAASAAKPAPFEVQP